MRAQATLLAVFILFGVAVSRPSQAHPATPWAAPHTEPLPYPHPHPTPGPLPPPPPPTTRFVCEARGMIERHGGHVGEAYNQYEAQQAALQGCFYYHRRCHLVGCNVTY